MKILFVEDEISKNIPRIIRLFEKYLGKTKVAQLRKLEEDESGYGAEPAEIKKIVESTDLIDLEYCFPGALKKIINFYNKYSMFIIDRNLAQKEYDYKEIKKIDPKFNEDLFIKFWEYEGDYLLQTLIYFGKEFVTNFYFLTAYPYEKIKDADIIKLHINFNVFQSNQVVDKSNNDEIKRLKDSIESNDILNIKAENEKYLSILKKYLDDKICDLFIEVLIKRDSDNRKDIEQSLGLLREILENIYKVLVYRLNAPDSCKSRSGIKFNEVRRWLLGEDKGNYSYPYFTNSLIRNYLIGIYRICSDFGIHTDYHEKKGFQPTSNTVNSLIFSMKEIILWFGEVVDRH